MLRGIVSFTLEEYRKLKELVSASDNEVLKNRCSFPEAENIGIQMSQEELEMILDLDIDMELRTKLLDVLNSWRS